MKRILAFVLALVMALALCGCGKSEAVKAVEEKISAIGTVSANSEGKIVSAERAFNSLSQEEKNQVSNYNTLLEARKIFDALPVPITAGNFSEYFKIKFVPTNAETTKNHGMTLGQSYDLEMEIFPVKAGSFNNLELEIRVRLPQYWHVGLNDPAYVKEEKIPESEYRDANGKITDFDKYEKANTHYMTLKLTIPSSGSYSETHVIAREYMTSRLTESDFTYEIVSAKGSFVK